MRASRIGRQMERKTVTNVAGTKRSKHDKWQERSRNIKQNSKHISSKASREEIKAEKYERLQERQKEA